MVKELTAQEAKDLAYQYRDNEEIYSLAKNLEDVLDGTRTTEFRDNKIDNLEDEITDVERERDNAKEELDELKSKVERLFDNLQEVIESGDKENALKLIIDFEV